MSPISTQTPTLGNPIFFPLQNNQDPSISLSLQFIIFLLLCWNLHHSNPHGPCLELFWSPSDFSILFALQLVHTIVSRDSVFLTLVLKTLCDSSLLTHYFWTISHSKQRSPWFRFCFTLHPHSGCAFQVSDFPLLWSISSQTCLCSWAHGFPLCQGIPLPLSSALWTLPSCFSQKVMFKMFSHFLPPPPKNFYSARWLHSTLEIPQ